MSAVISPCGLYRYRLERNVQLDGQVFAFFGINPSTADATLDDATIRKWRGFAERNGCSRFIVGNAFAFRATDVRELAKAADPVGLMNDKFIFDITEDADVLVPCWGSRDKIPRVLHRDLDILRDRLFATGKPIKIFGLSKSGDPLHPLMLGYHTPLQKWEQPA